MVMGLTLERTLTHLQIRSSVHRSKNRGWLRTQPVKHGVVCMSPVERVADLSANLIVPFAAAGLGAVVGGSLGAGALGMVGSAAAGLVLGTITGGAGGQVLQYGINEAFSIRNPLGAGSDSAMVRRALTGAAAGLAGAVAGSLGASPLPVALISGGAVGGLLGVKAALEYLDAR